MAYTLQARALWEQELEAAQAAATPPAFTQQPLLRPTYYHAELLDEQGTWPGPATAWPSYCVLVNVGHDACWP